MLTLSVKSDYGLLLLSLLAKEAGRVSIGKLSSRYHLSYAYMSRIAAELKSKGILESKEGVLGGYRLALSPSKISVGQVIESLDGHWAPTKCSRAKGKKCRHEGICPVANQWKHNLNRKLHAVINEYTLADLIAE